MFKITIRTTVNEVGGSYLQTLKTCQNINLKQQCYLFSDLLKMSQLISAELTILFNRTIVFCDLLDQFRSVRNVLCEYPGSGEVSGCTQSWTLTLTWIGVRC